MNPNLLKEFDNMSKEELLLKIKTTYTLLYGRRDKLEGLDLDYDYECEDCSHLNDLYVETESEQLISDITQEMSMHLLGMKKTSLSTNRENE